MQHSELESLLRMMGFPQPTYYLELAIFHKRWAEEEGLMTDARILVPPITFSIIMRRKFSEILLIKKGVVNRVCSAART